MREFDLIARHFAPLAGPGSLGLTDDAALLTPPPGRQLVISADALVAGVHFFPHDPADLIARKLLRVNLSDLAAMGATPWCYLLTLSAPRDTPETWFASFAAGLAADQQEFGITLVGGDTTSTPGPFSLTATVMGHVAPGQALRRSGARSGDGIWVTGTVGDAALGLLARQGSLPDPDFYLRDRYLIPRPRLGLPLSGIATAAMDVSDGLVQDLGHLCRASALGAVIQVTQVPLSPQAARADNLPKCLTGGDDYELLLAVPPGREAALRAACASGNVAITQIGYFTSDPGGVSVLASDGTAMHLPIQGWSHF